MSRRATARTAAGWLIAALVWGCAAQPEQLHPDEMTAPMSAVEVRAEVDRAMRDVPLPDGTGWKPVAIDPSGSYGRYFGGALIEFQALCAWLREAADATAATDDARLAAAEAVLADIPSWRTFSDPALMDPTSRSTVAGLIDDARRGEFRAVGQYLAANCR